MLKKLKFSNFHLFITFEHYNCDVNDQLDAPIHKYKNEM